MKPLITAIVLGLVSGPAAWSQAVHREVSRLESATPRPVDSKAASLADLDDASAKLEELDSIQTRMMAATERMTSLYASLSSRLESLCDSDSAEACEVSTHDALEYLELQNQMQRESRKFTTVSNALKARHDSAMASVRNMR